MTLADTFNFMDGKCICALADGARGRRAPSSSSSAPTTKRISRPKNAPSRRASKYERAHHPQSPSSRCSARPTSTEGSLNSPVELRRVRPASTMKNGPTNTSRAIRRACRNATIYWHRYDFVTHDGPRWCERGMASRHEARGGGRGGELIDSSPIDDRHEAASRQAASTHRPPRSEDRRRSRRLHHGQEAIARDWTSSTGYPIADAQSAHRASAIATRDFSSTEGIPKKPWVTPS